MKNKSNLFDIVLADFGLAAEISNDPNKFAYKKCGTPGYVLF